MKDTSIFGRVKDAIGSIKNDLGQIEMTIASAQEEIEQLQKSPAPRDDIKRLLGEVLAARAVKGRDLLRQSLRFVQKRPLELAGDLRNLEPRISILTACRPDQPANVNTVELALCGLLESQLQGAVDKFVDGMPWPEAGPPIADRQRLIQVAEHRLAKAIEDREELRRAAAQSGVLI